MVMDISHTCVKKREYGRPRSLAAWMYRCLFEEQRSEFVGLGSQRTELPYQSRHGGYGVEIRAEASEHVTFCDEL